MNKFSLLYVDDEESNLRIFKDTFRRKFNVYTAISAKEGMKILDDFKIDLVLSDQRMPEMNGVEFLKYTLENFPEPNRILITGYSDINAMQSAINNARIFQYIQKPWDKKELLKIIESALHLYNLELENKQQREELSLALERLKEHERKYKLLSDITFEGILIHDKGIVVDVNMSFSKMFAYSKEELIGRNIIEILVPPEWRNVVYENISQSYAKPYEVEGTKKDGTIIPVEVEARNIKILGKKLRVTAVRDITERKKTEWEIEQKNKDIIAAKEKAEESDKLKTEFLQNMSHEIRTPMNAILGFSGLLNKQDITEDMRIHYVNIIRNSGKQLLRIIDDILEISQLETKQVAIIEEDVCLNTLLLEQFSFFDMKAKEKQLSLYLKKGLSDRESTIHADKTKLNKIVSNLLENALKFTFEGFIEFGYHLNYDKLDLYVKDTGIGIEPKNQEVIFKRFSQEKKQLTKNVGGLGLGLSIAKENTELLGGDITLLSEKDKGSTFIISIPYKPVNLVDNSNDKNNNALQDTIKKHVYTILIVEDEELNYLLIETILKRIDKDLHLLHAKHGLDAIELCKQNKEIELVLMDLRMPVMDGFEATKEIKKLFPELPVIAQTAYTTDDKRELAFLAGCNDFIPKPINENTFNRIIEEYLIKN